LRVDRTGHAYPSHLFGSEATHRRFGQGAVGLGAVGLARLFPELADGFVRQTDSLEGCPCEGEQVAKLRRIRGVHLLFGCTEDPINPGFKVAGPPRFLVGIGRQQHRYSHNI
jgi:hypothetical protein